MSVYTTAVLFGMVIKFASCAKTCWGFDRGFLSCARSPLTHFYFQHSMAKSWYKISEGL